MARYEITVTRTAEEQRTIGSEWKEGVKEGGGYGYTPETKATREVTREIYKQDVEHLDLSEVIRAVNNL